MQMHKQEMMGLNDVMGSSKRDWAFSVGAWRIETRDKQGYLNRRPESAGCILLRA
jgi:hypothetical protein